MSFKDRNERVVKQLGMSAGKANGILRKSILFRLVQMLSLDICFRCGKRIIDVNDLTIEHKQPWLDRDAKLFWDLDNISFSHSKCNVPHIRKGSNGKSRILSPKGRSWCSKCKQHFPVESFYRNKFRWNGVRTTCKECDKREKQRGKIKSSGLCKVCGSNSVVLGRRLCKTHYNEQQRVRMEEKRKTLKSI